MADLEHVLTHTAALWPALAGSRLFITGGTGFFGTWLLETLIAANDALGIKVRATVLSRNPQQFLARMPHLACRREFEWLQGHPASFTFPATGHDYLVHLATATSANLDETNPIEMLQTKLTSIRHVLDYARHAKIKRVLVTSSGAVYGPQPAGLSHIPETYNSAPDSMNPASAYGNGKRLVEQVCALYPDIAIVVARCFAFIGPHLPLNARFAAGNFLRDAISGKTIAIRGDGTPVRSYLYAADLVIWLITLLLQGRPANAYNVGSDQAINLADLAKAIAKAAGGAEIHIARQPTTDDAERYVPSIEKARNELGLAVRVPLPIALQRTIDWTRQIP